MGKCGASPLTTKFGKFEVGEKIAATTADCRLHDVGVSGDLIIRSADNSGGSSAGDENNCSCLVGGAQCVGVVSNELGVVGNCGGGGDGGSRSFSSSIDDKFDEHVFAESKKRHCMLPLGPEADDDDDDVLGLNNRRPRDSMCGRFISLPS